MEPAKTVRIVYPANLRCGYCQIPASEFNPDIHKIWEEPPAPSGNGVSVLTLSDEELREAIESMTGTAPHHKTGRAKLIEKYEAAKSALEG